MEDQIRDDNDVTQETEDMMEATIEETTEETTSPASDDVQLRIADLEQQVQVNLEGWQRSRAEFTNYKRRTTQELADARERGAIEALADILPILDDFERAFANIPEDLTDHPWLSGTSLILKNLQKVLDKYQVEILDPVGEEFDPNFHEAIGTEDSDEYESGIVTTTLQKGYRSGERILRPALVRVAS